MKYDQIDKSLSNSSGFKSWVTNLKGKSGIIYHTQYMYNKRQIRIGFEIKKCIELSKFSVGVVVARVEITDSIALYEPASVVSGLD